MPTLLSRPSLATRTALLVGLLFLVQIVTFSAVMAYVGDSRMRRHVEDTLQSEAQSLARVAVELEAAKGVQPAAPQPGAEPAAQEAQWKSLERLARLAAERERDLGNGSYRFRVLDDAGQVRVDTGGDAAPLPENVQRPGIRAQDGQLFASARAHSAFLTVVASVDSDEVMAPMYDVNRAAAMGSVLSILFCIAGALFIARQVAGPVTRLRDAARKIALTGDLSVPIDVDRSDELGELAEAFRQMTTRMHGIIGTLQASAHQLTQASSELSASAAQQAETLTRHAAALQETQATAQEIRQTSVLAAQKAESILQVADKGDLLGREGESALEQSVHSLSAIRAQVEDIARQIGTLSQRALQIESITQTVKDLANQSNMLALNAAIEASRSGEHGKGFAVVAREIRSLADQSIIATRQVRQILEDVTGRISEAATVTEAGAKRMEAGLEQIRGSGDKLKELSNMVRDSSSAARQIAAAVSQQSAGISEIFAAVTEQNRMMEETLERIGATSQAARVVDQVSTDVARLIEGQRAA